MLVLAWKNGERIEIGKNVVDSVSVVRGTAAQSGISAPPRIPNRRKELALRLAARTFRQKRDNHGDV
jgi:sRNA-binding carbon storage regulator CsrA